MLFVGVALTLSWLFAVLPAALLAGLVGLHAAGTRIAVAVDDRLDLFIEPTMLVSMMSRVAVVLVVVQLALLRVMGLRKLRWFMLWSTALSSALFIAALARHDLLRGEATPAIWTGLALWLHLALLAPFFLVLAAGLATGACWRKALGSGFWAGITGSTALLLAVLGLGVGLSLVGLLSQPRDDLLWPDNLAPRSVLQFFAEEGRESARSRRLAREARLAPALDLELIPSAFADEREDLDSLVNRCLSALHTRPPGKPQSKYEEAVRFLQYESRSVRWAPDEACRRALGSFGCRMRFGSKLTFDDARDIASDKALRICEKLASRPGKTEDEMRAYFWRAVENARSDHRRRQARSLRSGPDEVDVDQLAAPEPEVPDECVTWTLAQLSEPENAFLSLCIENTDRELAARTGISKSKANRDRLRLLDKVRALYRRCESDQSQTRSF